MYIFTSSANKFVGYLEQASHLNVEANLRRKVCVDISKSLF